MPLELCRTGENCTILKIQVLFGPYLGNTTCLRTNLSRNQKNTPCKGSSNILYYIEMAQNGIKFWILSSFEQHCSILWVRLAIFKNKTCIRTHFRVFWCWSFNLWRDICSKTGFITKKGPKKQSDFEYCSVLTHFAQFQGLIWPFFGNLIFSRTLFEGFWGTSFNFWWDIYA